MNRWLTRVVLAGASLVAGVACGQSFNIDLDGEFGGRGVGAGLPSPSFGAAAGQPGYWNFVSATGRGPVKLRDLSGRVTPVTYRAWGGVGSGIGWRNPRIDLGEANDDFWLLMGDAGDLGVIGVDHQLRSPLPWRMIMFEGLEPGLYEVYTYAVSPAQPPRYVPVEVTVPGSLTQNPQLCTGPMPTDWVFRLGVTHTVHRVWAVGGQVFVYLTGPHNVSYVNGLQLKRLK